MSAIFQHHQDQEYYPHHLHQEHSRHFSYQQQPISLFPSYGAPPPLAGHHNIHPQHSHSYSAAPAFFTQPSVAPDFYQHQQNYNMAAAPGAYAPPLQFPVIQQQPQLQLPPQVQMQQQLPPVANNNNNNNSNNNNTSNGTTNPGGVSEVLDYDVYEIAKFLSLLSVNIFTQYSNQSSADLESKLTNVITATRLPKSSILLSILYLSNKVAAISTKPELDQFQEDNDDDIYTNVIISLLLANKFNDDSTFTNKSWSHASGLEIKLISRLEIEFLKDLNYDLKKLMEDSSFKILENSFDDWCNNNKHQLLQELIIQQQQKQQEEKQQLSPLEPTSDQFVSSPYYGDEQTSLFAPSGLAPHSTISQQQLPTPNSSKFNFSSSPITNPYNTQYYGYYNPDYIQHQQQHQRLQHQQQQAGYYYGLNDQFVPCY